MEEPNRHQMEGPRENQRRGPRKNTHRLSTKSHDPPASLTKFEMTPSGPESEFGKKVLVFLDGNAYSIFITIVTLYVLVADDIRQCALPPSADLGFTIVNIICMALFSLEMLLLSVFRSEYLFGFYFWLDFVALVSMLLDIMWINDLISVGSYYKAASVVKMVRASRASKIGSRSARLIRIIRLIRMLRLYKTASATIGKEDRKRVSTLKNETRHQGSSHGGRQIGLSSPQQIIDEMQLALDNNKPNQQKAQSKLSGEVRSSSAEVPKSNNHRFKLPPLTRSPNREESLRLPAINHGVDSDSEALENNHYISKKGMPADSNTPAGPVPVSNQLASSSKRFGDDKMDDYDIPTQTRVGNKLKEEIQKNIILMVLLILISVPTFSAYIWLDHESLETNAVELFKYYSQNPGAYPFEELDSQIRSFIVYSRSNFNQLIYLNFPYNSTCCTYPQDYPEYGASDLSTLRSYSFDASGYDEVLLVFDGTPTDVLNAQLSIARTVFICILLVVSSLAFAKDVQDIALEPLENMYVTVKKISKDPLKAIIAIENEAVLREQVEIEEPQKTEPVILENMIVKIGSLLVVGIGEAGSEMISKSIESAGGMNIGLQGKKIMAIFGFCDIRNFTDATEVLQTKVMNFVNDIAAIVHGTINRFAGSANKNIGDAFLLVWKFGEKQTIISEKNGQTEVALRKINKVRRVADLAVFSFVKIVAQINKSHVMLQYKNNDRLKARIKNYQGVSMGFGLHVGWAIEGGIGSKFKVDASYLGPNVNMASRLEGATKQFGTGILISGELADLMTSENKQELRRIDKVGVKGNSTALQLYTVDLNVPNLVANTIIKLRNQKISDSEKKRLKLISNKHRQQLLEALESGSKIPLSLFAADKDYNLMHEPYTKEFYELWNEGYEYYTNGMWTKAEVIFSRTEVMLNGIKDGPSRNLLDVIKNQKQMPQTGYRILKE